MTERAPLPDQSVAITYRNGWMQRGRELNDIYDALTLVVGRSPNGDAVEDIKALGGERDRLREVLDGIWSYAYGKAGVVSDDEAGHWTEIGMRAKEALETSAASDESQRGMEAGDDR